MSTPAEILFQFIREMNEWEKRCVNRTRQYLAGETSFEEATQVGTEEYRLIFRKCCSPTRSTPRAFNYSEPPEYDPDRQPVLWERETAPDTWEILTQQTYGHRHKFLFTLIREDGEWKVLKRAWVAEDNDVLDSFL